MRKTTIGNFSDAAAGAKVAGPVETEQGAVTEVRLANIQGMLLSRNQEHGLSAGCLKSPAKGSRPNLQERVLIGSPGAHVCHHNSVAVSVLEQSTTLYDYYSELILPVSLKMAGKS
jgi:hypothetical protein